MIDPVAAPDPWLAPRAPGAQPRLVLGCMNFGKRTDAAESERIIARALDAGVGLFDTANAYNGGASERIVGRALRAQRDAVRIASKVGLGRVNGRAEGLAPERIVAACAESLERLGTDRIDLYYLHAPDPQVPIDESLGALAELLQTGRIGHWGVSNHASWQILELMQRATSLGMPAPAVSQQLYNALVRQLDLEYFRFAERFPIHTTVYNPLAGGVLTGLHRYEDTPGKGSRFDRNPMYRGRYWRRALFEAVEGLREVAAVEGMTLVELAYSFVLGHPGVDSVLVGPGTVSHLEQALHARERSLSQAGRVQVLAIGQELVGTDASYAR